MSLALQYDLSANARIQTMLNALSQLDKEKLAGEVAFMGENQTRRRLQHEKTSPDGRPWQPWSEAYAKTRHGGQSLLQSEGDLQKSLSSGAVGAVAGWGSNLPYAAIHQHGGRGRHATKAGRDARGKFMGKNSARVADMPARPYLGMSSENFADLDDLITGFVARVAGAAR